MQRNIHSNEHYLEIANRIIEMIPKEHFDRVMNQEMCELSHDFIGFVNYYEPLAKMIPEDWVVIDFGAAYNPQCYLFKDHKRYIAVEPSVEEMFQAPNCDIYRCTTGEFIKKHLPELYQNGTIEKEKVFAICLYVPPWFNEKSRELVRQNFDCCYTFYPIH